MYFPLNDPFVIAGIVMLSLLVIIAIILLTVVQRRSGAEVWASVYNADREKALNAKRPAADFACETNTIISVPEDEADAEEQRQTDAAVMKPLQAADEIAPLPKVEEPKEADIAEQPMLGDKIAPPPKAVRFSSILGRRSQLSSGSQRSVTTVSTTFNDIFERWHRVKPQDLEAGPCATRPGLKRQSMSERQFEEMHLYHPSDSVTLMRD